MKRWNQILIACLLAALVLSPCAYAEETPTLKGLVIMGGELVDDVCTGPSYEAIVEKTGYQLDLNVYQPAQTETTVNMAMASREDYDYIRGASISMLFNYIENNAVAPLTESIEKYGADLKALFPEEVWNAFTMDDGNIYAIPSLSNARIWNTLTIRTDWLDALGLDVPSTTDEFIEVLRAFKEQDPGNVGKDNVIPFSTSVFSGEAISYDPFLGAFGVTYPWNERDGELVNRVELPEFKQYVEFYRTLYSEGLLDIDIAVVKDDTLQEKVNRGVVGLARYNYYYAYLSWTLWANEGIDWQMDFIPCPIGPDGAFGQQVDTSLNAMIFVPAWSKNVDDVIRFVNGFAQNYEYLLIGAEGVQWNWEDGKRVPVLPLFNETRGDVFFYQPVMSGTIEYPLWLTRVNKVPAQGQAYADCMAATDGQVEVNPIAFAVNLPKWSEMGPKLEKLINDTVLRVVVGDLPMEALDELSETWRTQGGIEVTEEVNAWFAANQ